ncbi:MAG: hypothetical protein HXS40_12290 [Theionarchaea archaeon]|nr:hypothetical protein [Theionarchaea archaeon]
MTEVEKSSEYRTIHVRGVSGNWHEGQFEILILSEQIEAEDNFSTIRWKPQIECRLILKPELVKLILGFLKGRVADYESDHGEIPVGEREKEKEKGTTEEEAFYIH